MADLKPSDELVAGSFAVATVIAVFGNYTAPVNDIQGDKPSNQTHNDTRRAAVTAGAIVSGVALLAKSPTVFVLGGATILIESWGGGGGPDANYTTPQTSN
jgi:hypothetical protein